MDQVQEQDTKSFFFRDGGEEKEDNGMIEKKLRKLAQTWDISLDPFTPNVQLEWIEFFIQNHCKPPQNIAFNERERENKRKAWRYLCQFVHQKLTSYRSQDIRKYRYDAAQFITFQETLALLAESRLQCRYCRAPIWVLYDEVRKGKQWTIDRIDNTHGHNRGNVVVACLSCNIKKRRRSEDYFALTQQTLVLEKLNSTDIV